jgi:serine/threonine-protein kinase
VDVLLEGTVRQSHGRVRINAQLVDAESNEQLWAQSYDRVLTDIFAIQSDVALQIVAALRAELSASDQERLSRRPTVSLDAWQLYLQGRHRLFRITENGIRDAVDLFGRAILEDPKFALAYSDLALAYGILGMGHGAGDLSPGEAFQRAKRAASRALELDPTLGQAHSRSGFLRFVADHDWAGAERDCRTGVELAPGDALAHDIHGLLLSSLGRYEEAIAAQRHAQELDPLAPVVSSDLATALLRAGRYDEALAEARRLISFEPDFPLGHSTLGWALIRKGLTGEGLIELRRATRLSPGNTLFVAQLGQAYGEVGRLDEAQAILRRLEGRSRRRYVSPYHLAYVHTGMGDQERAMDCLERAYQQRAGGLYGVNGSFLFRSLKPHPRYQALMVAMKLDQPPAARQGDGAGAVAR